MCLMVLSGECKLIELQKPNTFNPSSNRLFFKKVDCNDAKIKLVHASCKKNMKFYTCKLARERPLSRRLSINPRRLSIPALIRAGGRRFSSIFAANAILNSGTGRKKLGKT